MTQKKSNRIVLMASMVALVSCLLIGPSLAAIYHTPEEVSAASGGASVYHLYVDDFMGYAYADTWVDQYDLDDAITRCGQYPYGRVINRGYSLPSTGNGLAGILPPNGVYGGEDSIAYIQQVKCTADIATWHNFGWYIGASGTSPPVTDFSYEPEQPWIAPVDVTFHYSSSTEYDSIAWEFESISGPYLYGYAQAIEDPTFKITYAGTYRLNLTVTKDGIESIKTEYFTVYNPADTFSLSITPSSINIGENTTATISSPTGDFSIMDYYILYCHLKDSMVQGVEIKSDGNEPSYHFDGDVWQQVDDLTHLFTVPYGADFPESITLSGWDAPGDYECEATLFTSDNTPVPRMYADVTILGEVDQYQTVVINVRDSSDASYIYGATASLKRSDGTWENKTVSSGPVSFQVKDMEWIGYTATADGYEDTGVLYTQITQAKNIDIVLSKPLPAADPGFASLQIYVKTSSSGEWVALHGVSVVMSDGQTKITPESGLATFTMTANSTYSVTASKTGYNSLTIPITCGASTCGGYTIVMTSTSANPSVTATETAVPDGVTTYPPGVPMPGTSTTYPPGVPVQGAVTGNATARDVAQDTLNTWMIWGGTFFLVIFGIMLLGFSGDAIKKWSWVWK